MCNYAASFFFGHQRDTIFAPFCRSNCFRPRISSVRATCKCITLRLITFVTRHKPASPLVGNPSPRTKICKGLFIRYYNPTGFLSSLNTRTPHFSHSIEEFVLSIAPLLFSLYCIPSFSFFFLFSVYAGQLSAETLHRCTQIFLTRWNWNIIGTVINHTAATYSCNG